MANSDIDPKVDPKELNPNHTHSLACGHMKILHHDHIDYVEPNGHLHYKHGDHWDECKIEVSDKKPDAENHVEGELHNQYCGHERVPHGDHGSVDIIN
uniref:hypothetical protein n=1 Tax=Lentilactobacillus hilgardii TaxID=1588 RepID=UPI00403EFA41